MSYDHLLFKKHWRISQEIAYQLGQCHAIVEAISETPLSPERHQELLGVSLVRGALATTAIEGNTLTQSEVEQVLEGRPLPKSREYQEIEVRNVLEAMNTLRGEVLNDQWSLITPEFIKRLHGMIGKELGDHFDGIPGRFRQDERDVGRYRCPPYRDVPQLVQRLTTWLQKEFHFDSGGQSFLDAVIQAIVTHVYLEWIHPFGDGNGRTGRLLEFYILMRGGNPDIGSHILSNYYNITRPEYYRQLDRARFTEDLSDFIRYAVQGLGDGLMGTLKIVQEGVFETAWRGYVYDKFADKAFYKKSVFKRRRRLMLSIPLNEWMARDRLIVLTPELARNYADKSPLVLARDIKILKEMGLLLIDGQRVKANSDELRTTMAARLRSPKPDRSPIEF
jgi:Fic family protein